MKEIDPSQQPHLCDHLQKALSLDRAGLRMSQVFYKVNSITCSPRKTALYQERAKVS